MTHQDLTDARIPVTVSLEELQNGTVSLSTLEEAFGPNSLGLILVSGLPEKYSTLRHRLLSLSSFLANLPEEELRKLECPEAKWLVGWSCGKETLKDGQYDTLKGSYYANPVQSFIGTRKAQQMYLDLPEYNSSNVWPDRDVLPNFREVFLEMCSLIINVAAMVAKACDRYALENVLGYKPGYLESMVKESVSTKARLLHYFPPTENNTSVDSASEPATVEDDWCATHVDHGCLTGLTSAMFADESVPLPSMSNSLASPPYVGELDQSPDPKAGLYIRSRSGEVTRVGIPRDCLAFQTGEALEVITKGKFKAVPHFVRGIAPGCGGRVARNTLAVFTQPNLWEMIDENRDFATFAKEIIERNH
ncbi:hypothetical protein B0A49_00612 [Cryomyces minteri]|uniref:Clavaminate synthase-like protein n=1 Tax=Cryomyces minteri TaxID=331657 RepID=A0A4U0Y131_9PEZI|nr:hypothetical protein B0A49_00612 [Cryomyces minteri]